MTPRFSSSPVRRHGGKRTTCVYIILAVVLFFNVFVWTPLPKHYDEHRDNLLKHVADATTDHLNPGNRHNGPSLQSIKSKYAFATFLADGGAHDEKSDANKDKYFIATRILAYQLLHAPETRTTHDIPFIVLVSPHVTKFKRDRLERDGAIVWEAPPIESDWIVTDNENWTQVMAKLHLLELTQFDRIAFLDGDTILTGPLDDLFSDPAVQLQTTGTKASKKDEAMLPESYAFAAMVEMNHEHGYPPTEEHHDWPNRHYLNAGFFIVQPSLDLLNYYLSLTTLNGRFDPQLPEQNLLNYAHRPDGNMPWKMVDTKWNIHYPTAEDVRGGVLSLHEKWWAPEHADLTLYLHSWRWRMEGFHEARDVSDGSISF